MLNRDTSIVSKFIEDAKAHFNVSDNMSCELREAYFIVNVVLIYIMRCNNVDYLELVPDLLDLFKRIDEAMEIHYNTFDRLYEICLLNFSDHVLIREHSTFVLSSVDNLLDVSKSVLNDVDSIITDQPSHIDLRNILDIVSHISVSIGDIDGYHKNIVRSIVDDGININRLTILRNIYICHCILYKKDVRKDLENVYNKFLMPKSSCTFYKYFLLFIYILVSAFVWMFIF